MPASAQDLIPGAIQALRSLWSATDALDRQIDRVSMTAAAQRGLFRPAEDEALQSWFGRFLSVRAALWELLEEMATVLDFELENVRSREEQRCFSLAYAAACLVVRLDRLLVDDVARHEVTRRKLDEGSPERRIPRKLFTRVFESLGDPENAWTMLEAKNWVKRHRDLIDVLRHDPEVGFIWQRQRELETALDPKKRNFIALLWRLTLHSFRRRRRSAQQQIFFTALEAGGRAISEVQDPFHERRMTPSTRAYLAKLLLPGDVFVTRREGALTNLFLPGYWPHAALFVGRREDHGDALALDAERRARWQGDRVVLEALKDGVRFRPLSETLDVDAVAVLRPQLDKNTVARAIERACAHEGKDYNFDFDFFRADCLVCTGVIYRAFDGLGISFELAERAGRSTLSAEDILGLALKGHGFEVVAIFGAPAAPEQILEGAEAVAALRSTLGV